MDNPEYRAIALAVIDNHLVNYPSHWTINSILEGVRLGYGDSDAIDIHEFFEDWDQTALALHIEQIILSVCNATCTNRFSMEHMITELASINERIRKD